MILAMDDGRLNDLMIISVKPDNARNIDLDGGVSKFASMTKTRRHPIQ